MDDNPPQNSQDKRSPAPNGTGKSWLKTLPFWEVGIFEVLFVGVVFILLFGILNYFNILSISTLWPNQFGFIPQRLNQNSQPISTIGKVTYIPFKMLCPSLKEFCQKGEGVIKDEKYIGFGGKLASASAIFAAFDGDLTAIKTEQEKFKILYLDNPNLKTRATYFLRGQIIKKGKVSKGEQIAITNGKTIGIYDNNSLIFSVIRDYPTINNPVILTQEHFE